jgi:uncharacterized membrane protein (UPF0182 family)
MEPNFVVMKLPDETAVEFVEILPFTPANRNNLIGWIAGRSDGEKYGCAYREFRPYQPASLWHANRRSRRCSFLVGKHIGV